MESARSAVLFDMDGVLVFTETLKANAHVATIEQLGGAASINLYIQMLGQSHEIIRTAYMEAAGLSADPILYTKQYRKIYHDLLERKLVIRPGAQELVRELHHHNFLRAVVSSSSSASVAKILEKMGLQDGFDVQVTSDEVVGRKPDPAPYRLALEKLGVQASNAVVLEDSPSGIESAVRAGTHVIAVRHDYNRDLNFEAAESIIESFSDVRSVVEIVSKSLKRDRQE